MVGLHVYLFFHGNCGDAMRFYHQTLGGKLELQTHADNFPPEHIAPGNADRIIHARLELDDGMVLMASDNMADDTYKGMEGFNVCLLYQHADDARRVFEALSEGGKVISKFEKTFFSEGFGMLRDRFGTPWMVNVVTAGR